MAVETEKEIRLSDLFYFIFRRKWLILGVLVAAAAGAFFYTMSTYKPMHESVASMVVNAKNSSEPGDALSSGPTSNEIYLAQKLVSTYTLVLKSDRIMQYVIDELKLSISPSYLRSCVSLSSVGDTQVLFLKVTYPDAEAAIEIANAIIDIAPRVMMETVEIGSVNVLDGATTSSLTSICLTKNVGLGAVAGLTLGIGVTLLIGLLFPRIKNPNDIKDILTMPTLGEIEHLNGKHAGGLLVSEEVSGQMYDSFMSLSASVRYILQTQSIKKLLVTSALEGEGKTFVSINLAGALSQSGKKVLLIDCDLRKPSVGERLGISKKQVAKFQEAVVSPENSVDPSGCIVDLRPGLSVIPYIGVRGGKGAAFFNSHAYASALETLCQDYDFVIIDSTPAYSVAETMDLARICEAVLLVVKQEHAPGKIILETAEKLAGVGAKIIGCALNNIRYRNVGSGYTRKYKYYYYEDESRKA